ncbi:hypothetical protein [Archangium primigenium]|uniref:hypothetical protein n=1 Tax=[Archangium] primigenium TaxID=2792470 RepID=UPI001958D7C8|nr:hypothetical protein [Archangium primigenium]MBM7113464.1 hypothetical protein [Archangium primigenium]
MSGRRWVGVGLGLVLVGVIAGLVEWGGGARSASGWRRLPMLPADARQALPTFLRPCESSADCDALLVCQYASAFRARICVGSDCTTDSDCPPSTVCRWIPSEDPGARVAVSACAFSGVLPEGAPCVRLGEREDEGCEPHLVCADWCGRRCGSWLTGACPEGTFCALEGPDGPVCLPTCEGRACPKGQDCVRRDGGVSVCARVHGSNCQREPCAPGRVCRVDTRPFRPGEAWMACATPCEGEGSAARGCDGLGACLDGRCWEYCSPMEREPCLEDFVCVPMGGESGACVLAPGRPDAGK